MYYSSANKFIKYFSLISLFLFFALVSTSCGDSGGDPDPAAPANNPDSLVSSDYVAGEVLVRYKSNAFSSGTLSYLSASISDQVLPDQLITDGIIAVDTLFPLSLQKANAYVANATGAAVVDDLNRWRLLTLASDVSVDDIIQKLSLDPNVEFVQPNYKYSMNAAPSDPLFSQLWGLQNTAQVITKDSDPALAVAAGCAGSFTCNALPDNTAVSGADMKAVDAWDINTGNPDLIIAVIDTGVDYTHPDLDANIWTNPGEIPGDGVDNDGNGYIDDVHGYDFSNNDGDSMDDNGHGTHIAGTIAAEANNGIGVVGINWRAKIMGVKAFDSTGGATTVSTVQAIEYAASFGVKISNNSWGGTNYDQTQYDAIATSNSLFVVAAGNFAWDNDRGNVPIGYTSYPGSFDLPNIITVTATDNEDNMASFSSYGLNTSEVGAPGVAILSTVPTGTCQICNAGIPAYTFLSGTSMATPHVAGAVGLIVSKWPGLNLTDHRTILEQSADAIAALADKVSSGRININNALRSTYLIKNTTLKQNVLAGSTVTYNIQLSSLAGAAANLNLSLDTGNPLISGALSQNIAAIAANGSQTITAQLSVSAAIPQGKYKIKVNASDFNGIQASAFLLLEVLPDLDLVITSVNTTATKVDAGDQFVVTASIKNNGSLDINTNFGVSFFVSTDQNVAANRLYQIGGFRLPRLAAGATYSSSTTVTMPVPSTATAGVPLGNYYIRAIVDSFENVIELNETNNTTYSPNTITVAHEADIIITNVSSTASSFLTGEFTSINVTMKNQGQTGMVSSCASVYLSTDAAITPADTSIIFSSLVCFRNLAPGASQTRAASVKIPSGVQPGSYYLGAYADPFKQIIETNVNNNAKTGSVVQIIRDIDIAFNAMSLSSTTLVRGGGVSVNWTLENLGQSITVPDRWFGGYVYLSTDSNITSSDTYLGFQVSGDIWPGAIGRSWSKFVTIPGNTPIGGHYIGVIADPDNTQPETNEANNTASIAVTIQ